MNRLSGRDVPAMARQSQDRSTTGNPVAETAAGPDVTDPARTGRLASAPTDATPGVAIPVATTPGVAQGPATGACPPPSAPVAGWRFWAKVEGDDPLGCWVWTGHTASDGYGRYEAPGLPRRSMTAHRAAYIDMVGPIPNGLVLDHLCRNRACVNPYHLDPVTYGVNNLRSDCASSIAARRTHCIRGHEFTPKNTGISKAGHRRCRTCQAAQQRARWRAQKANAA